jgi:NADH:ubiquinone oxidoreductase subunit 3 (subunit A)
VPLDYDEIQMAKERQIKWICLLVAVVMAGVAAFIINNMLPEKKSDSLKDEAFKKGLHERAKAGLKR